MKLKVIVTPDPKPAKPQTIIDKTGINNFLQSLYRLLRYDLEIVHDENEWLGFLATNRDLIKWFMYTDVKSAPYLKVVKGGEQA